MAKSALLRIAKPLLIVLVLGFVALTLQRGAHDAGKIPTPSPSWLIASLLMFMIHYAIQAVGWHAILRALGEPVTLRVSARMYYMSIIARWMPGRIWYSATRLFMAREAGIKLTSVTFGMVFELIYIMMGGILATALFAGAQIKGLLTTGNGQAMFAVLAIIIFGCTAVVIQPGTLIRMHRFRLFRKAVRRLAGRDLSDHDVPAMSTGRSLALLTYFTLFWIYSGVMFGVLARAFVPMNAARWLMCIPAFAGSWLIGFFSIVTPAGLGAREGAMWLMLKSVMPQADAIILAIASRLMMLATELLSVGLAYLLLRGAARLPSTEALLVSNDAVGAEG